MGDRRGARLNLQRVSDAQILEAYERAGSVKKAARVLGIHGSSIHERLQKLQANRPANLFTQAHTDRLRREYVLYRDAGKLDLLAKEMGRTRQLICRQAGKQGLTDPSGPRTNLRIWKGMSEEVAEAIFEKFKRSKLGMKAFCLKHGYGQVGFWKTMSSSFPDQWEHVLETKVPKQTMYRLGRAFEYRTRDHLKRIGYFVLRSPASRSPLDLIAVAKGAVLFVQCKRGGGLPPAEWNALYDLAVSVGAAPIYAQSTVTRGVIGYTVLTGRKDGTRRRQPHIPFDPGDLIGEAIKETADEAAQRLMGDR